MYIISKEIGFDYGHRVPDHRSKCFSPHGHRGKVVAYCKSDRVIKQGEQTGMVLDFGFLKDILTTKIHDVLDHAFIFSIKDERCLKMFSLYESMIEFKPSERFKLETSGQGFKCVIMDASPTAENLAECIFYTIYNEVIDRSDKNAILYQIDFWETPTSMASYSLNSPMKGHIYE